ncbi:hypothetical protein C1I63_18555 [Rathayibacter caricis DSM 15933]|uniref:Uncharacterized protein n=1 Tax=Rathayibacter caricis DSM 15933 TaxID=1328867 RepID=A0A2T4UNY2_9MICO|nr:hypothetical protein [Rathayibacter caricis]PTL71240.1 hypothetical protein C1I63_18555 [Rathayibacter caricis DSM 15933]
MSAELDFLQNAVQEETSEAGRRKRWARPVVTGVATLLLFGGAATTAAATGLWQPPWWADEALTSFSYTLPSGAECNHLVGVVQGSDPESIAIVESFYRDTDIDALLNEDAIDTAIAQIRSEENMFVNDDGSKEPAGWGTAQYSADHEYDSAVSRILMNAVDAKLDAEGLLGFDQNLTYLGNGNCPGADW